MAASRVKSGNREDAMAVDENDSQSDQVQSDAGKPGQRSMVYQTKKKGSKSGTGNSDHDEKFSSGSRAKMS